MKNVFLVQRIREQIRNCGKHGALIMVDFKKGQPIDVIALEKDSKGEISEMEVILKILKNNDCHPRMIKLQTDYAELESSENVVQFKVA